jgi:PAS domain S-box-containing protein
MGLSWCFIMNHREDFLMAKKPHYDVLEQRVKELEKEALARKRAEEALRESEKKYREIFKNISDLWFQLGLDGTIQEINLGFKSEWGYGEEEIFNMNIKDLMPERYKSEFDVFIKEILQNGEAERIICCMTKDSQERLLECRASLIIDESGNPVGIRGAGRDMTERLAAEKVKLKLEKRMQQAQKMEAIGALAGGIAHDFNNILFPILGYTEMTMDDVPEESLARRNLEEVFKAANRAKDLVQQILTFSRETEQKRKPLSIQLIIKEALKLLRASFPSTIDIHQDIDKKCRSILADPTQIHQVLMNLCTNSYHAMRENGGVLGVSLREVEIASDDLVSNLDLNPGGYLKLTVSDTGHGMDREVAEQIFNPYFTTKAPGEGTGMGLAVVHGIVKSYGGHITVYSEPNQGTTFHVYLPRIDASEVTPETLSTEPPPKGKERILLVDDEPPIVRMVQQMLENLGYHVTARTGSIDAFEAFCVEPDKFDLVITDQTMPHMTGTELAQKIMSIRPGVPIILCTGFSEVISEKKAKAIGILEYAMKPVIKSDLAGTIRKLLDKGKEE